MQLLLVETDAVHPPLVLPSLVGMLVKGSATVPSRFQECRVRYSQAVIDAILDLRR
jgi:hypothetical protein